MKRIKYCSLVIFFIYLLLCNRLTGHPIPHYFYQYKSSEGLSNNTVYCSFQDSYGFLWFGTKDGLNRFDGHNFDVFRRSYTSEGGLGSNFILALAEDKSKTLWVGTDNGIYYSNTNTFHLLDPIFKSKEVYDIEVDHNNSVWFLSKGELYSYHITSKSLVKRTSRQDFILTTLAKDNSGGIFAGSNQGKLFALISNNLILITDFTEHLKKEDQINIQVIRPINDNEIIVGTTKYGILKWNKLTNKASTFFTDHSLFVRDIHIYDVHTYWYATENGLYIHNISNNTYINYKKKINDKWGISDNAIYNILKDNQDGIWLGTYFAGVNYFHPNNNHIQKIYPTGEDDNIQGSIIRGINQDKNNNIWIGTEDAGFSKWDKKSNIFYNYSVKTKTIANNNVHGLLCIGNNLWVSTFFNGVDIFNMNRKSSEKHIDRNNEKNGLQSSFINFLFQAKNGSIYATTKGIYKYNPKIENFVIDNNLPTNIIYTSIFEDSNNNLWLGTYRDGLFLYNPKNGENKHFLREDKSTNNLPHNSVNYIYEDSNQTIWVATDEGIAYLDSVNNDFITVNSGDIKFGNIIYGIIEDEQKNLWISSSYGLLRYNIETGTKRVFNTESGIISMAFNYNSVFKDRSNNLYFGSTEGLITFAPSQLNAVKFPNNIPLYITNFQLQEEEIKKRSSKEETNPITIPFTKKITLEHDQSSFTISIAALLFQAPRSITYQYTMEGLNSYWTTTYDNRKVYFTKLAPGNYTFKVRAKDPNGNDIPLTRSLKITILAPWYATKYALFAYLIIIISILLFIYNYYLAKIKLKNKAEMLGIARKKDQELFQSKMTFFIEVAHEIRTPLTLIKAPLEKLISSVKTSPKEDKLFDTMHRNTDKLIKLSNQLLDFRKTEIAGYALELSNHNIEQIFSKTFLDFSSTFKSLNKKIHYYAEENIIAAVDVEAFEMICTNLLSNALKYSNHYIEITLKKNAANSTFKLQIKNDGPVIEENESTHIFEAFIRSQQHKSINGSGLGLALTKSLIEKHGGSIIYCIDENNLNTFEVNFNLIVK